MSKDAELSVQAKRGRGRPRIEFPESELKVLGQLGCTDEEIAGYFHCDVRTIEMRRASDPDFAAALANGDASGRISIRRKQMKKAMSGDNTMLIWLGKQRCGQKDKIAQEHSGSMSGVAPTFHVEFVDPTPR